MSAQTREQHHIRAERLLNNIKHPEIPDMLWFYSDKNIVDHDQKINRRNDRWLCRDPSDFPHAIHVKFQATADDKNAEVKTKIEIKIGIFRQ